MMSNKRKILLVSGSIEEVLLSTLDKFDKIGMKTQDDTDGYPLGLAYLHAYLEKAGHEVRSLFLNNYGFDYCQAEFEKALREFNPDIIGFQVLTQNRVSTYKLIEYAREVSPNAKIVLGGIHASIMYAQLLEKYPEIIVVLGEGEKTLAELSDKIMAGAESLYQIKGIAFSDRGKIRLNPYRELILNLDEIPFPKHELFFQGGRKCGIILTARGCPFHCSFCSLDLVSRRRVRYRSLENVMAEIEWMISRFPKMTDLWIQDDTFFLDNARVMNFCDEILKRQIKLNFICSARFKPITPEMVKKLEEANFIKIFFGLESGDNEILKKCHKGINQEEIISAVKLFRGKKIGIYAHLIVGLPGESEKSVVTTAKLVQKIQRIKYINYQTVYLLTVYPGTEVYELSKKAGVLDDAYWLSEKLAPIYTAEHSLEELYEYKDLLLYHISGVRAFTTWPGFKYQFAMIPCHLKFFFRSAKTAKWFLYNSLRILLSEKQFAFIKKINSRIKKIYA